MNISVKAFLNHSAIMSKLTDDRAGTALAHEWKRLIDDYVPMQTGQLSQSNISYEPWEVHYDAPYAIYVYNGGRGGHARFSHEFHGKASKLWDSAAIKDGKDKDLIQFAQNYYNKVL